MQLNDSQGYFKNVKELAGVVDRGSWGTMYKVMDKEFKEVCVTNDKRKAERILAQLSGGQIIESN